MGVHSDYVVGPIVEGTGLEKHFGSGLQLGSRELLHCGDVFCLHPRKKDTIVHVAGCKTKLFNCIVDQGLERSIHILRRRLWLACSIGRVFQAEDLQCGTNRFITSGGKGCEPIREREVVLQFFPKAGISRLKIYTTASES